MTSPPDLQLRKATQTDRCWACRSPGQVSTRDQRSLQRAREVGLDLLDRASPLHRGWPQCSHLGD